MNAFLTQLFRMSLTAGWMTLLLLILRPVMKKMPRRFSCLAWGLVAIRLALPISLESKVSLVPQAVSNPELVANQLPMAVNRTEAAVAALSPIGQPATGLSWVQMLPVIWAVGAAALTIHALVGYIRLLKRVQVSMKIGEDLYLCDHIRSPFVLGLFRPKIYLPSDLDSRISPYVLAHERMHLKRRDPAWKLLGYGLLCIHWFNPLCYVAYILFCRDLEQSCDEAVVRNWNHQQRKDYSAALLECSMPRHVIAACPVAFGEVGVKQRIRGVLQYRKPKSWVICLAAALCITLAACLLTNPVQAENQSQVKDQPQTEVTSQVQNQSPAELDTVHQGQPQQEATTIIIQEEIILFNSPNTSSKPVRTLTVGETAQIIRTENIGDEQWAYLETSDAQRLGWAKLSQDGTTIEAQEVTDMPYEQQGNIPIILGEDTVIRNSPNESSLEKGTFPAGSAAKIIRRENVNGSDWAYISDAQEESTGWAQLSDEDVALSFFRSYVAASALDTPDTAESYLYFRTEPAREFYRQMYSPVTGWDATGVERVLTGLWCIRWESNDQTGTEYAFVLERNGQLYVAQNVHALPDDLLVWLDVSAYERDGAMYMNDDLLENQAVTTRLLQFAEPSRVTVEIIDDTWQVPQSQWQIDLTDAVCSTDTWRVADIPTGGGAKCIVTLYTESGAGARLWDVDSSVLVTYPDGAMECYRADLGSYELLAMVYQWAVAISEQS